MRSYNKSVYKHYIGDNGEKANWVERMGSTQFVRDCAILGEAAMLAVSAGLSSCISPQEKGKFSDFDNKNGIVH